jgi:hypothetical protein
MNVSKVRERGLCHKDGGSLKTEDAFGSRTRLRKGKRKERPVSKDIGGFVSKTLDESEESGTIWLSKLLGP